MSRRLVAIACLAFGLASCAVSMRGADRGAGLSNSDTALDGRLVRCSAHSAVAQADPDCISAFAEARRRILPASPEN